MIALSEPKSTEWYDVHAMFVNPMSPIELQPFDDPKKRAKNELTAFVANLAVATTEENLSQLFSKV